MGIFDELSDGFGRNDIDAVIKATRIEHRYQFTKKDGTKVGKEQTAAIITYEADGSEWEDPYVIGNPDNWKVSSDGQTPVSVYDGGKITKNSDFGFFLEQFISAGGGQYFVNDKLSDLIGLQVHINQVQKGDVTRKDGTPYTVAVITSIAGKVGAAPNIDPMDLDTKIYDLVPQLVKDGAFPKAQLGVRLHKALGNDPHKNEIMKKLSDDAFLKELEEAGLCSYKSGKIGPLA